MLDTVIVTSPVHRLLPEVFALKLTSETSTIGLTVIVISSVFDSLSLSITSAVMT